MSKAPLEVKEKVEVLISEHLSTYKESILVHAMKYAVLVGGKRIRPELIVQTGRMLGADDDLLFEVASGFEMLHASTLLFDDMPCIDDDDIRRGKPTTHKVFGEATATLAGCSLICSGLGVIAKANPILVPSVSNTFGANRCMYGQQMDVQATGTVRTLEYMDEMHIDKTGSLIENSIQLGYLCSDTTQDVIDILDKVGVKAGLLFQIHNDILDVVGYDGRHGEDVKQGKKTTYPGIFGLDKAIAKRDSLFKETIQELQSLPSKYNITKLENVIEFITYRDY
jgi:geranylgeranyl diphosphate synthase type II